MPRPTRSSAARYDQLLGGISTLLESARRASARVVNAFMTASYWEIGRRIVEHEQKGARRAEYGEEVMRRLADDLTNRFGRGFGYANLNLMRQFFLSYPRPGTRLPEGLHTSKLQSVTGESDAAASHPNATTILQSPIGESPTTARLAIRADSFPLPWTHYVRLLRVKNSLAREFYEREALAGGWTVRQLDRQINSLFYERAAASRNQAAMLRKGQRPRPADAVSADEELRHPLVLEFLNLKDEYSERDLEEALIRHLETFLLELGPEWTFVGRQRRLRIGQQWYRLDLLFFHRRLRCLVIFDLKTGALTHADTGQMHLYLNFAREHWTLPTENPPVGVILCSEPDDALVRYALEGLSNKILVREYQTLLPREEVLAEELRQTRRAWELHRLGRIAVARRRVAGKPLASTGTRL